MGVHNLPPHGSFDERPGVDFVGAAAVLLLVTMLSGLSGIALLAIFGRAFS